MPGAGLQQVAAGERRPEALALTRLPDPARALLPAPGRRPAHQLPAAAAGQAASAVLVSAGGLPAPPAEPQVALTPAALHLRAAGRQLGERLAPRSAAPLHLVLRRIALRQD